MDVSLKDKGTVTSVESSCPDPSVGIEETSTPEFPFCVGSMGRSFELLLEGGFGSPIVLM